jgi:spore coat polysaccharide biosynthesis protein SpsF (cytidylyltransferase family)
MHVRSVAIIQARMTSTRLPGKVMADLCGKPALEHMIERVRRAELLDDIVVATTVNADDDPVSDLCRRLDIQVFRGDEADVLGRFQGAAAETGAEAIIRLTGDCPMIDPKVIDEVISVFDGGAYDHVSNCNIRTYPDGLDVEAFTRGALNEAAEKADHPYLREHVTPYIRGSNPEFGHGNFALGHVVFEADLSHLRWTLDTVDDLDRIRRLITQLPRNYSWFEALSLATRQPELLGPKSGSDAGQRI